MAAVRTGERRLKLSPLFEYLLPVDLILLDRKKLSRQNWMGREAGTDVQSPGEQPGGRWRYVAVAPNN